ncbi:MAG: L-aspartate oxidase [Bdellovibrionales bacterium CG10_big_fil_rev_8_21_14_0_10_45_34]|nr:MAG: L-aspartate oxidase [Bdellovibrionales bacterium CG10_big_fil_rev_8_21_14_0_10_45_34]
MSSVLRSSDFLVVGGGISGLLFALEASKLGNVRILAKKELTEGNTPWAQGGIAAHQIDDLEAHKRDTLKAGAGLCREFAVEKLLGTAPDSIALLRKYGVNFEPHLGLEGGHSARRIHHVQDQTGKAIHAALIDSIRANKNIEVVENCIAIDLIIDRKVDPWRFHSKPQCLGVYALDKKTNRVATYVADEIILATGGAGKVYLYTSNWEGATGDGIAMAYRAGCRVSNLEFMQFHPTCLFHRESRNFLITEALRGDGAILIDHKGNAFAKKYHEKAELAPRDIVARAIDAEIKKSRAECVYLDARHLGSQFLEEHYPQMFSRCLELGIDIRTEPIPVVPAAHYLCGGVLCEPDGTTDVSHLYVLGESACTGLHGANRLASNSLLECAAMAQLCVETIRSRFGGAAKNAEDSSDKAALRKLIRPWQSPAVRDDDELIVITHMWNEVRHLMSNYVGIVRSNKRLERAHQRLVNLLNEVKSYYDNLAIHPHIIELRNITLVAHLTILCARKRKESRGIHYNIDWPETKPARARDSIV